MKNTETTFNGLTLWQIRYLMAFYQEATGFPDPPKDADELAAHNRLMAARKEAIQMHRLCR